MLGALGKAAGIAAVGMAALNAIGGEVQRNIDDMRLSAEGAEVELRAMAATGEITAQMQDSWAAAMSGTNVETKDMGLTPACAGTSGAWVLLTCRGEGSPPRARGRHLPTRARIEPERQITSLPRPPESAGPAPAGPHGRFLPTFLGSADERDPVEVDRLPVMPMDPEVQPLVTPSREDHERTAVFAHLNDPRPRRFSHPR